jgi:hypothetical protein
MKNVKEKILFVVFVAVLIAVEFLTAWLLRSMPNDMMKVVLISIPLLVGMVIEVIILSFGGVKQNES